MSGDDTAYLVYLGLLLLFVGGYFLYDARERLSQTMQYAAIWGLIFAGVIIAYGLKDTLSQQLYPSAAAEFGNEIQFQKARDGHFHADLIINGQAITFLVDTGATSLVLSRTDAERVGIKTNRLAYLDRVNTANGVTGSARVRLDRVQMGPIDDRDVAASVNEGELSTSLLGMDYLSRFGEIRIRGDRLTLIR